MTRGSRIENCPFFDVLLAEVDCFEKAVGGESALGVCVNALGDETCDSWGGDQTFW